MLYKIQGIKFYLNELTKFYLPLSPLANSYIGSIFTKNLWDQLLPEDIKRELKQSDILNEFTKVYINIMKEECSPEFAQNHPNLMSFLWHIKSLSINTNKNFLNSVNDLETFLKNANSKFDIEQDFHLDGFMSKKKLHEVKVMSKLAGLLSNLTESSHVVDVGGGKGYLSWILALNHKQKVLGLDASQIKTCNAVKRSEKVAESWRNKRFESLLQNKKSRKEFVRTHYKSAIVNVTPTIDIQSLMKEHFNENVEKLSLMGLHTCGDLALTSLEIFIKTLEIKSLINVGCCYHKLTEEFDVGNDKGSGVGENWGFPASEFLRKKKFTLGRNARLLASQSLEKLLAASDETNENGLQSLFYRAILETIVVDGEKNSPRNKVGKLGQKCSNFHDYMVEAVKRLNLNVEVTETYSKELYEAHINLKPLLTSFFWIRVSLAPIVESIILLDRLLYLLENGIKNAHLVKLFDLKISPRGFGLLAWKEN